MTTDQTKRDQLFQAHIDRLSAQIEVTRARMKEQNLGPNGMEAANIRDDAKQIALLREGIVPKFSDLPVNSYGENNLPEIEMFTYADIMDETAAATHDLDLIDYGKQLMGWKKYQSKLS